MAKKELTTDDITLDDVSVDPVKTAKSGINELDVPIAADLKKLVAEEAFLSDVLDVYLPEPADENDFPFVFLNVNNIQPKNLRRGETHKLKRYEVEALARAKYTKVRSERRVLADGSETMEQKVSYHPVYPFSVISDPAGGRGTAWLKNILSQPA